jgi:hypothetical protein
LKESLAELVFQKTQRRPLILPVVIKIWEKFYTHLFF